MLLSRSARRHIGVIVCVTTIAAIILGVNSTYAATHARPLIWDPLMSKLLVHHRIGIPAVYSGISFILFVITLVLAVQLARTRTRTGPRSRKEWLLESSGFYRRTSSTTGLPFDEGQGDDSPAASQYHD